MAEMSNMWGPHAPHRAWDALMWIHLPAVELLPLSLCHQH